MKENKNYHGVTRAIAEAGYSDTLKETLPPSSEPYENAIAELSDDKAGGFLERQNVYERI